MRWFFQRSTYYVPRFMDANNNNSHQCDATAEKMLVGCIQSMPANRFRKFANCNSVRPIKIVETDINVENSKVIRNEKRYRFRVRFLVLKYSYKRSKVNAMKSCRFCVATKLQCSVVRDKIE